MVNYGIPICFYKGLKSDQPPPSTIAVITAESIFEYTMLRWYMKQYGMNVEIKRSGVASSTQMLIHLVKFDSSGRPMKSEFEISVSDYKIEKGLFELEKKIIEANNLKSSDELETILEMLRDNELSLPPHSDLRNEIIMSGNSVRLGYMGTDSVTDKDMYGGFLFHYGEIITGTPPQKGLGFILDNIENALFAKRREAYRRTIGEQMLKLRAAV